MDFPTSKKEEVKAKERVCNTLEIPQSRKWIMQSKEKGREYHIMIAMPSQAPPPSGYPVVFLLDGNSVFATMAESLRMQCHRPDKTGVIPAIIVGIGYDTNQPFAPNRYYDFTPVSSSVYSHNSDGLPLPEQGGATAFLNFIENELKPKLNKEFVIDNSRQAIFGHSLGGLFTLYVLFTRPEAFQFYIAGSPSIHWNQEFLLEEERKFTSRLARESFSANVLIGMGELEKRHPARNYDHAKALAERLSFFTDYGVHAKFTSFADEGHVSVLPALISRTLCFSLKPTI